MIAQITPIGFTNLGWKYFIVYIATNLLNVVFAYLYFPETKGKSLEEIGLLFGDKNVRMPMIEDPLQKGNAEHLEGANDHKATIV